MMTKHVRTTINVSHDPNTSFLDLAYPVNTAVAEYGLGATMSATIGIWEDVVEDGTQIEILFPDDADWRQKGLDAVEDTLDTLRGLLPNERYFQVTTEIVGMALWSTETRRFA